LFFLLWTFIVSNSQSGGSITSVIAAPERGAINNYIYTPPLRLALPARLYALVVYTTNNSYHFKRIPIEKREKYQFSFKAPDSSSAVIISISDEKNVPVDNNNELGYISYLNDETGGIPASAGIDAMYLLSYYAIRPLKLNYQKLKPVMIDLFEEAYRHSPDLVNTNPYHTYYLRLLFEEKGDTVTSKLLKYANEMEASEQDESKWINAISTYRLLNMGEAAKAIEQKAISRYPKGKIAADNFLEKMSASDTTESLILASMKDYINRFGDTSIQMKYTFYSHLIGVLLQNKIWERLNIYESFMPARTTLASMYNNYAFDLSGGASLDDGSKDLQVAKMLSGRSLNCIEDLIKNMGDPDEDDGTLQRAYHKYLDTYARILYKQGQYDSAFYYKDKTCREQAVLNAEDVVFLVTCAEKTMGPKMAYKILAEHLLKGISSAAMISQLNMLGKKSGLSDSTFDALKFDAVRIASENSKRKIYQVFGSSKNKNFELKNLKGQTVTLASFRGKIVVIDFWATWCIPCKASFPKMQEIVNGYKNDPEVIFLFIDTWENKEAEQIHAQASMFMNEAGYDFEVLLDMNNRVAREYKVDFVPSRFILDRNGNIIFMGESSNLLLEIEDAKGRRW